MVVALAIFVVGGMAVTILPSGDHLAARLASLADPLSGSAAIRLHIWRDSFSLLASRPLTGYGPDSFGLVYPRFQSGDWVPGSLIDKAHSDVMQLAATQGLLGVAAFFWLVGGRTAQLLAGPPPTRRIRSLGGWAAYQVTVQLNFFYLPAAAPFWLFLAVAAVTWEDGRGRVWVARLPGQLAVRAALGAGALPLMLFFPAVVAPFLADSAYMEAQAATALCSASSPEVASRR